MEFKKFHLFKSRHRMKIYQSVMSSSFAMERVLNVLLIFGILKHLSAIILSDFGFIFNEAFRPTYCENVVIKTAKQYSYPVEEHTIKTEDGYTLKLLRMPSSPVAPPCRRAVPVYLSHGLFESSDIWMVNGPQKALAYVLADSGYDVWMGNARGNTHSRKHKNLSPNSRKFWEFSFHEIAIYDNSADIDYILSMTKQNQLHYIGHSQGAATFFVLASLIPEYNKKIITMHAIAPVVFSKYQKSHFFTSVAKHVTTLEMLANNYGLSELLPNSWLVQKIGSFLCTPSDASLCYAISRMVGGQSRKQETPEIFPQFLQVFPAGSSMHQLLHIIQGVNKGEFRFFDFGMERNLERYGSKEPPEYPLQNVTASPIFIYVSQSDTTVNVTDIERLVLSLPKKPIIVEMDLMDKEFGHVDYIYGKYAKEMVYDNMLKEMMEADGHSCY